MMGKCFLSQIVWLWLQMLLAYSCLKELEVRRGVHALARVMEVPSWKIMLHNHRKWALAVSVKVGPRLYQSSIPFSWSLYHQTCLAISTLPPSFPHARKCLCMICSTPSFPSFPPLTTHIFHTIIDNLSQLAHHLPTYHAHCQQLISSPCPYFYLSIPIKPYFFHYFPSPILPSIPYPFILYPPVCI